MATNADRRTGDCPTVGVDATSIDRFTATTTDDGDLLLFDEELEDAWIQSDVYLSAEAGR